MEATGGMFISCLRTVRFPIITRSRQVLQGSNNGPFGGFPPIGVSELFFFFFQLLFLHASASWGRNLASQPKETSFSLPLLQRLQRGLSASWSLAEESVPTSQPIPMGLPAFEDTLGAEGKPKGQHAVQGVGLPLDIDSPSPSLP